jgi:sugar lactone lactonase YvrE
MKTAKNRRIKSVKLSRRLKRKQRQKGGQNTSALQLDISIYSGGGSARGYVNNTRLLAKYNEPWGITRDSSGNIYIADKANNCIRKIDIYDVVTTFAGVQDDAANTAIRIKVPVNPGYVNGNGTAARLRRPQGIVCDKNNNLFFVETDNHVVRKIDASGNVTTFAGPPATTANSGGQALKGFVNGPRATATFNQPFGITIDSKNNLYVADNQNNAIRKIDASGNVTTFAGGSNGSNDGIGTAAKFKFPYGVVCDLSDNVFVADYMNGAIRRITPSGVVTTIAGGTGLGYVDGIKTAAKLRPVGITLGPDNTLFVADGDPEKNAPAGTAHRIRIVDIATGRVTTLAGNGTQTPSNATADLLNKTFSNPTCMLYDSVYKRLFVVNTGVLNPRNPNPFFGNYINVIMLPGSTPPPQQIKLLAGSGRRGFADGAGRNASFKDFRDIGTDSSGNLIVVDVGSSRIRKVTPDGMVSTLAGSDISSMMRVAQERPQDGTGTNAILGESVSIYIDANDNALLLEVPLRIRKITPDGVVTTLVKEGVGAAAAWELAKHISSIAVSPDGIIYISSNGTHKIFKITFEGPAKEPSSNIPAENPEPTNKAGGGMNSTDPNNIVIAHFVGSGNEDFVDGFGQEASFNGPNYLAVDANGNLLVSDVGNRRIRMVAPDGKVTTLAGSGINESVDGSGPSASFTSLGKIAVDSTGDIYVVDSNKIRKVTSDGVVTTLSIPMPTNVEITSMCLDRNGNMFILDDISMSIFKIRYLELSA